MGIILAKFWREKKPEEILEKLDTKIKDIESYSISTQEKQKRFVGNFLVISIGLYVISSIIFFFAFFPSTWSKRIVYSAPLLIFPVLIIFLKRLVVWYFDRKLNRNADELKKLRAEKKKVIEQVKNKLAYNVVQDILNRFDDTVTQQAPINALSNLTPTRAVQRPPSNLTPYTQPRLQIQMQPQARTPINARAPLRTNPLMLGATANASPMSALSSPASIQQMQLQRRFQPPQQNTPFPIINQNAKNLFEKLVDYVIGEGPGSRYGMICKECHGHNGMVSEEEYEYSAFKCAFCKALNPAKKLRPVAPRLPLPTMPSSGGSVGDPSILQRSAIAARLEEPTSSTSVSDRESGSESEPISVNESMELMDHKESSDNKQQSDTAPERPIISQTHVDDDDIQPEQTNEIESIADETVNSEPKSEMEKKNE